MRVFTIKITVCGEGVVEYFLVYLFCILLLRTSMLRASSKIYCTAHGGWDVTGYQGLFCPSNKPSCDRLPGGVQLVKTGGRGVFVVKSGHI